MILPKPKKLSRRDVIFFVRALVATDPSRPRPRPSSPVTENVLRNDTTAAPREDDAADGQGREPEAIAIARVRLTLGEQCLNQVSRWKTISVSVIHSVPRESSTE